MNQFSRPTVVRVNSSGWVYVSDHGPSGENHRVLRFKPPFSNGMNGEVFGSGFVQPAGIDFDPTESGKVWIMDAGKAVCELWTETSPAKLRTYLNRADRERHL